MAFCVMIRDVGEDPLSPALRDIQRERERGQNCTRDTVVSAGLERETLSSSRRTYKKFAFKIVESKSKLANPFSFLLKIYSDLQNSQITVYFFCGREFVT